MNRLDKKIRNYYIEEQKIGVDLIYFIINIIIKDQLYVYVKMKREIYLEDMLPFHGQLHHHAAINLEMDDFYLL